MVVVMELESVLKQLRELAIPFAHESAQSDEPRVAARARII